jgi:CsoR family transcriptional regulator, copper-sensing transcriptional repressor
MPQSDDLQSNAPPANFTPPSGNSQLNRPLDAISDTLNDGLDDDAEQAWPIHAAHSHDHTAAGHAHVHNEASLRRVVNRLSRIEGHIRGIKSMVQESRPCPDVLVQIAAVRGALDRVARVILDEHLTDCIARAAKEGDVDVEIAALKAALDRFFP